MDLLALLFTTPGMWFMGGVVFMLVAACVGCLVKD
jgi:hypothetical protein